MSAPVLVAVIIAFGLAVAGCGRSLDEAKVATADLNAEQQAVARSSRALTRRGGASAIVMTFLRDVADGAGPVAVSFYDRRVSDSVGTTNLLGALDVMAGTVNDALPAVVRRRNTSAGVLVVVRLLRTSGADTRHSFLMRRERGRWMVVYDSLLAEALQAYVVTSRSSDPSRPPVAATVAARRAVSALRRAALQPPSREAR